MRMIGLILLLAFQAVKAQVLTTDPSRPLPLQSRQFHYSNLGPSHSLMGGVHRLYGFEIEFQIDFNSLPCQHAQEFIIEMAIIHHSKTTSAEKTKNFLDRCGEFLKLDLQKMLMFEGEIEDYLKQIQMPQDQLGQLSENIKNQKIELEKIREALKSLRAILLSEDRKMTDKERYKNLFESRQKLMALSGTYLKHLAEIVFTTKAGNLGAARTLLREFINLNAFRLVFEVSPWLFNSEWSREDHEKLFLEISLFISTAFQKELPLETDIFITQISQIFETRLFSSLSSRYQTDWSLVRIREQIALNTLAYSYPSFWYSQLSNRTSVSLVSGYINDYLDSKLSKLTLRESLWIFLDQAVNGEQRSQALVEELIRLPENDWYHQFIQLEYLNRPSFRDDLSKLDSKLGRPVFLMKREYFRSLLIKGQAPTFALMNLALIGDFDRTYLWLLAAMP